MSRKFPFVRFSALGAGAAFSALAFAATPAHADDDVVITGRFPTPAQNTASDITVITAADIARRQSPSVFEALRGTPGVSLTQNGGPGQTATVRLRGGTSDQTLVLIDGVPVNDPSSPSGYDFAYLDSGVVERIEILRGAGSAIWGSDALGGVINIVTFEPGENAVRAYAEGGSYTTGRIGARATYTAGPLTISGYGTAFKTNGISAADSKFGFTEDDGAQNTTLSARATLALGAGFSAQLGVRSTQGQTDFDDAPAATGVGDSSAVAHSRESQMDARLNWRSASDRYGAEASISRDLVKRASDSPTPFSSFYARGERTLERISADAKLAPEQTLLIGAEHERLETLSSNPSGGASNSDAGFATYSGRFFKHLLLEGGVRYQTDSRFGDSTTGRIGAALDVWRGGVLRATYGNAFKAPTLDESTGGGFTGPNPDLKPETSNEWEIGGEQKLFGGAAKIGIVYFDRQVKDLIQYGFPSYFNVARADSQGVELTGSATIGRLDLNASYTHDKATNHATNAQLLRVPKDQASLEADWRATRAFSVGAGLFWNGDQNDTDFNGLTFTSTPVVVPSWTRVDLRASYRLNDNVELYGRIENLADEQYEEVFGYGTPGRSAYFGVRVKG